MHRKFLVVVIAAMLAGCGNPTTNGSGIEQNSIGVLDSSISWMKKIVRNFSAKATMQIPAQGVIADALLDPQFVGSELYGSIIREYSLFFAMQGLPNVGPGSTEPGASSSRFLAPVAAITAAYRGWQINLFSISPDEKVASPQGVQMYLEFQEASVEYTNALFTRIAGTLNEDIGVLEDPAAAKLAIQNIYKAIPEADLKTMWVEAVKRTEERRGGGRTIDMASGRGVDWSAGVSSFSGNQDGLAWIKSGVAWFGQGALSGKQWTIALESSTSKSIEQSSGGSEGSSGSTGEKTGVGAQPK